MSPSTNIPIDNIPIEILDGFLSVLHTGVRRSQLSTSFDWGQFKIEWDNALTEAYSDPNNAQAALTHLILSLSGES